MNLPFYLARNVARGGTRSVSRTIILIAAAAVAVSMATMVLASAMIAGFKGEISDKVFQFWGHIHVTDDAASYRILDSYNYPISNQQDFYPSVDTLGPVEIEVFTGGLGEAGGVETVRTKGGVKHIQQFIVLPGVASSLQEGESVPTQEAIILKGIAEDYNWETFEEYVVAGEPLRITADSTSRGILISQTTSDRLRLDVGDRVDFAYISRDLRERPRVFRVQGIYKTGLAEFDEQFAIVDIKHPQALLGWEKDQIGGFEILVDDLDDLDLLNEYIHYEVLPQELYSETIRRKIDEIFTWIEIQDYNFYLILILMTIVAIINMITALLILILERTNMIGILKALGQSNWSIRTIFLYYAAFIVIGGLLLGNLLGLALCWLQKTFGFIRLDEAAYYLEVAPIRYDWSELLWINLAAFSVTVLALILPSYLVTRIDPVKAIRFK